MANIAILGKRGFISSSLFLDLKKNHIVTCFGRGEIPSEDARFDLVIDATSQKCKSEVSTISNLYNYLSRHKITDTVVMLQSFSTLTSSLSDPNVVNFGVLPDIFTPYSKVKFHKENVISKLEIDIEVKYLYLPLVLGAGGIWESHTKRLLSQPSVAVYSGDVFYTDISHLSMTILELDQRRAVAVKGKGKLTEILNLSELKIIYSNFRYENFTDKSILKIFKAFNFFPILPHGIDFLLGKLLKNRTFPSFFYWELFKRQSKSNFYIEV